MSISVQIRQENIRETTYNALRSTSEFAAVPSGPLNIMGAPEWNIAYDALSRYKDALNEFC